MADTIKPGKKYILWLEGQPKPYKGKVLKVDEKNDYFIFRERNFETQRIHTMQLSRVTDFLKLRFWQSSTY